VRIRAELPNLLTNLGLVGTCVEVGTYQGDFAANWLDHWPGHLVCVDAWKSFPSTNDILNHDQATMDRVYEGFVERMKPYAHRQTTIRALSVDAARLFLADGKRFDCVYIDASHDYGSVVADLVSWWPLVKPGGMFAGHDYLNGDMAHGLPADFGVKAAVDEFVEREHLKLYTTEEPFPTWWVFKDDYRVPDVPPEVARGTATKVLEGV
jgi:hypothetical protein